MNKDQIKKIVDFSKIDDSIIFYHLDVDDYCGFIQVNIDEQENATLIFSDDPELSSTTVYSHIEHCDLDDFRFYKKVDIFKEVKD